MQHLLIAGLADDGGDGRPRLDEGAQVGVGVGLTAGPSRRTKRGDLSVAQAESAGASKELGVFRIRAGPAAFYVVDADLVELTGDLQLVLHGQTDPLHLRAVAEGCVVQLDASLGGHFVVSVAE